MSDSVKTVALASEDVSAILNIIAAVVARATESSEARAQRAEQQLADAIRDLAYADARAERAEQALAELVALHPIEKRARFLSNRAEWDAVQDRSIAAWAAARAIVESK